MLMRCATGNDPSLPANRAILTPGLRAPIWAPAAIGLDPFGPSAVVAMLRMASANTTSGSPTSVQDPDSVQEIHEGKPVLAIEGAATKVQRSQEMPQRRFGMLSGRGNEVYTSIACPSPSMLAIDERSLVPTRLAFVAGNRREITIHFYDRRDAAGASL